MTVAELIAELEKLPPYYSVFTDVCALRSADGVEVTSISGIGPVVQIKGERKS